MSSPVSGDFCCFFPYNTDLHFANRHIHKYAKKSYIIIRQKNKMYAILDATLKYVIVRLHSIYSFSVLCYVKGQKRGQMKHSEVFKDSIIFLFVLKLKSSDPYRRIFKSFSCDKFFKVGLKAQISLRRSVLRSE